MERKEKDEDVTSVEGKGSRSDQMNGVDTEDDEGEDGAHEETWQTSAVLLCSVVPLLGGTKSSSAPEHLSSRLKRLPFALSLVRLPKKHGIETVLRE